VFFCPKEEDEHHFTCGLASGQTAFGEKRKRHEKESAKHTTDFFSIIAYITFLRNDQTQNWFAHLIIKTTLSLASQFVPSD